MIKFGSTTLSMPDPNGQLKKHVETYLRNVHRKPIGPSQASVTQRGKNILYFNHPELPETDINQLVIPTGATRWSSAYLLATDSQKAAIYTEAGLGPLILNYRSEVSSHRYNTSGETVRSDDRPRVLLTMWALPPLPIPPVIINTRENSLAQGFWLIPIVDERYFWQFQNTGLISDEDFTAIEGYRAGSTTTSTLLLEYLFSKTTSGTAGFTILDLHADYDDFLPDVQTDNNYEPLAPFLESVAAQVGLTIVPNMTWADHQEPTSGKKFALLDPAKSLSLHADNMEGVGTLEGSLGSGSTTENIGVPSLILGDQFQNQPGIMAPYRVLVANKNDEFIEVTAGSAGYTRGTVAETEIVLRYAWTDTTTEALALRIATDFYARFAVQFDQTFGGVQPFQPNAFHDVIIHRQDIGSDGIWPLTRMRSIPFGLYPEAPIIGGGGTEMIIQFRIISSDFCDSCTVKARVIALPIGVAIGSLPDIDTYDNDSVTIYDKSGCFFNEPEEDLLNRFGFAHRLNFLEDGPCANTIGELWAVTSLCCDDLDCTDLTA
jgi:hypothetical protein